MCKELCKTVIFLSAMLTASRLYTSPEDEVHWLSDESLAPILLRSLLNNSCSFLLVPFEPRGSLIIADETEHEHPPEYVMSGK